MAEVETNQPPLPEVSLQWVDFMWSLEKLRHKPYGEKLRERDWFRINPLEMVLLGAHSIATNSPAKRDHGTMMLVMHPLRAEMRQRPRYWRRLFSVLCDTLQGADVPAIVLQRCSAVLMNMWDCMKDFPEFQAGTYSWCVRHIEMNQVLQRLLTRHGTSLGVTVSVHLRTFISEAEREMATAKERCDGLVSRDSKGKEVNVSFGNGEGKSAKGLASLLGALLKQFSSSATVSQTLALQVHMMLQTSGAVPALFDAAAVSMVELLTTIAECCLEQESSVSNLLNIIQLLSIRHSELDEYIDAENIRQLQRQSSASSSSSEQADDGTTTESEAPTEQPSLAIESTTAATGTAVEKNAPNTERVLSESEDAQPFPLITKEGMMKTLFAAFHTTLLKWVEMVGCEKRAPDVASKLLELAGVMLARRPLGEAVIETIQFFAEPLTTLMMYSTEGYLSDCPHEFLAELMEFVSSMVEQGTPALSVLQNHLPNLFGPAFGIRSHTVSCRLLEFGNLAVCSQHKKAILTEGLRFLMDVFYLFPSLDKTRAAEVAAALHTEALCISNSIIKELMSTLPLKLGEEGSSKIQEKRSLPLTECEDSVNNPLEPLSDVDRELDRDTRLKILLKLLQLACAMIRNGDNISFLYASILPKLFQQPSPSVDSDSKFSRQKLTKFFGEDPSPSASSIAWQVDKKKLALQLLDLSILSVEHNVATPFQLCGIAVPKLVKNLDKMSLSHEEKLSLTLEVLRTTQETLEAGHSIDELISHGIDLLSSLLPPTATYEELRLFVNQMAKHFVTSSHTSLLFMIKNSCKFMTDSFPEEAEDIRKLFKTLTFHGKRDEIRGIFRVCKDPLKSERFTALRSYIYCYTSGKLSHRQVIALCELLVAAMDIEKGEQSRRGLTASISEEEEEEEKAALLKEKHDREMTALRKLTFPCLKRVEDALQSNSFRKEVWESVAVELSQVALFRTLFQSEFASFCEFTQEELQETFKRKFPVEVLSDKAAMQLLSVSALRMEHMQIPRFESLKKLLSNIIRHFLTLEIPTKEADEVAAGTGGQETMAPSLTADSSVGTPPDPGVESASALEDRKGELEGHLKNLPRNIEDIQRLVECGYSSNLWNKETKPSLSVLTDGSYSLEENMRQTLLACYTEFAEILKQMAITHVSMDGEMVKSSELFSEELTLTDLKGRRARAVRVIDERLGRAQEGHFYERKVALLAKEDEIEADFEKQTSAPVRPHTFKVALNTSFFDCASCCGSQIIGCYAPSGEHCERPLEIGIRCDSAIASVYDESGIEIENAELLFTEEGAYIFKAYSNGHPYDTSQVWVGLLTSLLQEPAPLVPAIIVPKGYPNQRTWDTLRRCVSTELTGSMLTCRHDFSPEWRTYYDLRPERVRLGMDIVLHPGFTLTAADISHPLLRRQKSRLTKDLAGLIFEELMRKLLEDDWLKQFRFLGKVFSQYISVCVAEGVRKPAIVEDGFDYDRWKRMVTRMKTPPVVPESLQQPHPSHLTMTSSAAATATEPLPTREAVVGHLVSFLDSGLVDWCAGADLPSMCCNSHKQFLDMKRFLENSKDFQTYPILKKQLISIRELLMQCTRVVPVMSVPESLQEQIIHWIFRNEDRVWRYRGGRDGHETLQQFMHFLGRGEQQQIESGGSGSSNDTEHSRQGGISRVSLRQSRHGRDVYAGVAVFCLPYLVDVHACLDTEALQVDQMIGYAVGEQMMPASSRREIEDGRKVATGEEDGRTQLKANHCYEVVIAWVHPRYRGLNLSVKMYLEIGKQVPARLVMCDMLAGSVERIIASTWLLRQLNKLRVLDLVVRRRQQSYTVITQDGRSEQFEQVLFSTRPLRMALMVYDMFCWCRTQISVVSMATIAMVVTPIIIRVVLRKSYKV